MLASSSRFTRFLYSLNANVAASLAGCGANTSGDGFCNNLRTYGQLRLFCRAAYSNTLRHNAVSLTSFNKPCISFAIAPVGGKPNAVSYRCTTSRMCRSDWASVRCSAIVADSCSASTGNNASTFTMRPCDTRANASMRCAQTKQADCMAYQRKFTRRRRATQPFAQVHNFFGWALRVCNHNGVILTRLRGWCRCECSVDMLDSARRQMLRAWGAQGQLRRGDDLVLVVATCQPFLDRRHVVIRGCIHIYLLQPLNLARDDAQHHFGIGLCRQVRLPHARHRRARRPASSLTK